jgi:HNH endonuclease
LLIGAFIATALGSSSMEAVHAYVGVTDGDWYRFLRDRYLRGLGATEVNFWQPSGGPRFGAIPEGAPFLFKSKKPDGNRIVGGGFLSGWASLPIPRAWEFFGEDNGCATEEELRTQIRKYRDKSLDEHGADPEIGCIMLNDVRFFDPDEVWGAPPGWPANIQKWRIYDLASPEGSYLEQVLQHLSLVAVDGADQGGSDSPGVVPGPVFGQPRLTPVRVGQAAFKALVQEAYGRRCAVTGSKILPVLQAAHIRPVTKDGENRVNNGLLLRSDVHTLFDRGFLGVHPQKKTLLVSPRLRADWGSGEEFYQRALSGETIGMPRQRCNQPNEDFLTWHTKEVFDNFART